MIAYRIARDRYPILDGTGAAERGGRWNSPGRHVIYAGGSFAIAVLEKLVYLPSGRLPANEVWATIAVPNDMIERLDEAGLPGWDADDRIASRAFGDSWYDEGRSVALLVPSVVTRLDRNVVISARHPAFASVRASNSSPVAWDRRLFLARV